MVKTFWKVKGNKNDLSLVLFRVGPRRLESLTSKDGARWTGTPTLSLLLFLCEHHFRWKWYIKTRNREDHFEGQGNYLA